MSRQNYILLTEQFKAPKYLQKYLNVQNMNILFISTIGKYNISWLKTCKLPYSVARPVEKGKQVCSVR